LYFNVKKASHGFKKGAKLEAVDLRSPSFVGAATVIKVAENILLLHFDGWRRDLDLSRQLITADSPDIYPCGWAEMTGHQFQGRPDAPLLEDCDSSDTEEEEDELFEPVPSPLKQNTSYDDSELRRCLLQPKEGNSNQEY